MLGLVLLWAHAGAGAAASAFPGLARVAGGRCSCSPSVGQTPLAQDSGWTALLASYAFSPDLSVPNQRPQGEANIFCEQAQLGEPQCCLLCFWTS